MFVILTIIPLSVCHRHLAEFLEKLERISELAIH